MSDRWLQEELTALTADDRRRHLLTLTPLDGGRVRTADGRVLLNLCGNDFLGLSRDARVIAAAQQALTEFGAGSQASRLVTGNQPLHERAEQSIADLVGAEAALLTGSGWHVNTGLIPALVGKGDVVFSDERNHASLIDGCRLSRAAVVVFRHADAGDLAAKLRDERAKYKRALVVTESVFSMDGDCAPLTTIVELAEQHDAMTLIDEAHAVGVWGEGRGLVGAAKLSERVTATVVTFGKALGAFGAAVCGSRTLREWLVNRQRSLIFSTAPSPADVAAAAESTRIIREEGASLRECLQANVNALTDPLREAGVELPQPCGPIVPVIFGDNRLALDAAADLETRGILARAIRPPSVAPGTARLRLTVSAAHDRNAIVDAARAIVDLYNR